MSSVTMVPDVDDEPEQARSGRRRLAVLLTLLVIVAVAAAASWWVLLRDDPAEQVQSDGAIMTLEPLTTTLGEATLRHARVSLAVVLVEGEDPEQAMELAPELQDALLREVAEMDADHLRSAAGSQQLREQLTTEARRIWGEDTVRRVLLTELLVQ